MPGAEKSKPGVWGVLLAAGASRRFGSDNKLLAEHGGVPLVRHAAEQLLASSLAGVVVVTGYEGDRVGEALAGLDIGFADNPDFSDGLASSLRAGLSAVPADVSGAMIVLADMPGTTTELVDRLLDAFGAEDSGKIVYPAHAGVQGNPVIWPGRFFEDLRNLTGDSGAKRLIGKNKQLALAVPVEREDALRDIDQPEDLTRWRDEASS